MVGVAQLVERRLVVADVAGSSPVTHPYECGPVPPAGGAGPHAFAGLSARVRQLARPPVSAQLRGRTVRRVQAATTQQEHDMWYEIRRSTKHAPYFGGP